MPGRLIIGLGNPGKSYEKTRHNIGFATVRSFAEKRGVKFKLVDKLEGALAQEEDIYFLLPMTYMNASGRAVKKVINYFKLSDLSMNDILVVVDDVYLDFGVLRIKSKGSSGGHNGLKSIAESLLSEDYSRLRMGIGPKPENFILEDYVLGKFSEEEQNNLPEFISRAHQVMECWLTEGIEKASHLGGQSKQ